MPVKMSKDGQTFFDVDDSPDSQQAAEAKGYKPFMEVTKDGQQKFNIEATPDSIQAATQKGYVSTQAFQHRQAMSASKQAPQSALEVAGRGVADYGSMGFGDELTGAVGAIKDLGNGQSFSDNYAANRDFARGQNEAAQQQDPITYHGAGIAAAGLNPLAQAGSVGGAVVQGALNGFGSGEGGAAQQALSTVGGGALAGGGQAVLGKIAGGTAADELANFAETRATKSLEPILRQQEKLNGMGATNTLGRELLDSGVVKAGRSVNGMVEPLEQNLAARGKAIGDYRAMADAGGAQVNLTQDAVQAAQSAAAPGQLAHEAAQSGLYAKNLGSIAQDGLSPTETQGLISRVNEGAGLTKTPGARNTSEESYNQLRKDLVAKMDGSMGEVLKPEDMQAYLKHKELFSALKGGEEALDKSVARHGKNATFGLRDTLMAAGALTKPDPTHGVWSAGMAIGSKLVRERGNSTLAVGADKISDMLASHPEAFGKFAGALQSAAQRGPQALSATHYLLQQTNPEYRKTINGADNEETPQLP